MIDQVTIDRIIDNANIVEVISEFVKLKKAGSGYKGLCPFHHEKTPSFNVSPARGIYKCFGCGKGGNAIQFLMEHERISYYEALKFLANKFHIEIIEKEYTADDIKEKNEIESLKLVTSYAQKFYSEYLWQNPQGRAVGLAYFKERGFRDDIIQKFQLGYSPSQRDAFTKDALLKGYKSEYLIKTGLTLEKNQVDRFNDRVIFPIHNLMGRVIAFGARILKADQHAAKYLNSPESEIYHKSKVLYGIFQAKRSINQTDKCYLVEGYTDVISLHQSGIENVVASSGTSLTPDQVRLIKRFTNNITVLYDGDMAGIKASIRGIDIILEEGMNVKVLLLPDNEDPDSFARKKSATELLTFISENETDFITFKAQLYLEEAQGDPVKKAGFIKEIVRSIALIPDSIARSVYIRECSKLTQFDEKILYSELNKIRRKKYEDLHSKDEKILIDNEIAISEKPAMDTSQEKTSRVESEIMRLLLLYGDRVAFMIQEDEHTDPHDVYVAEFIVQEFEKDGLNFENQLYQKIFTEYRHYVTESSIPPVHYFIHHIDNQISKLTIDLVSDQNNLSRIWKNPDDKIPKEEDKLDITISKAINTFKNDKILKELDKIEQQLKSLPGNASVEEYMKLQSRYIFLSDYKIKLSKTLGDRVIQK